MKIEGPGKTTGKNVSRTRKTGGSGGIDFDGLIAESGEAEAPKSAAGVATVGRIDALLTLQEDDFTDSESARKQAQARAEALLDQLDEMRVGMLNGVVSRGNLQSLARIIQSHRNQISDPRLASVLDEIDLRAQVELAKFTSKD